MKTVSNGPDCKLNNFIIEIHALHAPNGTIIIWYIACTACNILDKFPSLLKLSL